MLGLEVHKSTQTRCMYLLSLVRHLVHQVFVVDRICATHSQWMTKASTCSPHEIWFLVDTLRVVLRGDSGEFAEVFVGVVFFVVGVWDLALDVIARLNTFPPFGVPLE